MLENKKLNSKSLEYNIKVGRIIKINIIKFNEKEIRFYFEIINILVL